MSEKNYGCNTNSFSVKLSKVTFFFTSTILFFSSQDKKVTVTFFR